MAVPATACDNIAISGATVAQTNLMGRYTKVSGQLNDGKPVFRFGTNFLYYSARYKDWAVSEAVVQVISTGMISE